MGDLQRPLQFRGSLASVQSYTDRGYVPGTKLIYGHIRNKDSIRYVMLFDRPAAGTGSSVSTGVSFGWIDIWQIAASGDVTIAPPSDYPIVASHGFLFVESTAATSYVSGASNLSFHVLYG